MSFNKYHSQVSVVALIAALGTYSPVRAQGVELCIDPPNGIILEGCEMPNAGDVIVTGVEPNTEPDTVPVVNSDGFVLSLDGEAIDADPSVEDAIRATDIAIANANVRVQVNTLDPIPRLDVEIAGAPQVYRSGDTVTLLSETNYPAFISRAEMRLIDRAGIGGARLLSVVPIDANGEAQVSIPEGNDIVVVHRVYDSRGRFDETEPLSLLHPDDRGQLDIVEEGTQSIARRGIRVEGGSVTVSADNVAPGAVLTTMGERVRADGNGRVVVERILPAGEHSIDVKLNGGGQGIDLQRPVSIAGAEWFYVGVVDLTIGRYSSGETGDTDVRTDGRLQYYIDGELSSGYRITSSLDTGYGEIEEIFSRLNDTSVQGVIDRLDTSDGYPTYGDDSTVTDDTPTSGNFYLRVERDNSFFVWGDYQASLGGNGYVRSERTLYGAQLHYETESTTSRGDATVSLDLFAAQPDQLIGRDILRGTGGSVYFLRQQGISPGTATVSVEVRDAVTGRVIERVVLVLGRDYDINNLQGVVTLTRPLTGSSSSRLVSTIPGGDEQISLVVQYEYTPTGMEVDGLSYGARIETWATDDLRIGLSGISDDSGVTEQRSVGLDFRYELGNNSFVQLDYANSEGPGIASNQSIDGGLVFGTEDVTDGEGRAVRLEAQFDLTDLGSDREGVVGGYAEHRQLGFASLDHSVTSTTGDETLVGFFAHVEADHRLGYSLYADRYENGVDEDRTELGVAVERRFQNGLSFELGLEYIDETTSTILGTRLDAAARIGFTPREDLTFSLFAQGTLRNDGLASNDRYGLGVTAVLGNGWTTEAEISDGDAGAGTRVLLSHAGPDNSSTYFGYELDPGRAVGAGISARENGGRYVVGGRRQISDRVGVFGENTYTVFGQSRELISAYGVTYSHSEFLTFTTTVNFGQLTDDLNGDIERTALSFGLRYEQEDLQARARIELRQDDYEDTAEEDTDAIFLTSDLRWTISREARLLMNMDIARTEANGLSFQIGRYVDASVGYAFRPINNEKVNTLARYRYFYDSLGQEVDGIAATGPVQESHIVSLEVNYDINQFWTLGGKVGGRFTDSAPVAGEEMASNDAWLAVFNARYHVVHNWDILVEARHLDLVDAGTAQTSVLGAAYRHVGQNTMIGLGYNFGQFSTDLTDLTQDDEGLFLNIVANF